VAIDATGAKKPPYMGGFRNKRTGVEYHHAGMQTDKRPTDWKKAGAVPGVPFSAQRDFVAVFGDVEVVAADAGGHRNLVLGRTDHTGHVIHHIIYWCSSGRSPHSVPVLATISTLSKPNADVELRRGR